MSYFWAKNWIKQQRAWRSDGQDGVTSDDAKYAIPTTWQTELRNRQPANESQEEGISAWRRAPRGPRGQRPAIDTEQQRNQPVNHHWENEPITARSAGLARTMWLWITW